VRTETATTGRAKTVLVFGHGADAVGVVSAVVVQARADVLPRRARGRASRKTQPRSESLDRLSFAGPATFDGGVRRHVAEVILPTVDRILDALNVCPKKFEISLVNLSAASAADIGLKVSGFSVDVALFLALLSASLQMPIPPDVVATGHIASHDGDIRMVGQMPAKLGAAIADPSAGTFIHPSVDSDSSLSVLSEGEKQRAAEAIVRSKGQIRAIAVDNLADLLQATFPDETIIQASLQQGFFQAWDRGDINMHPAVEAVRVLVAGLESRFWAALERLLLNGEVGRAKDLLIARARFEINRKTYPANVGRRLLQLLRSLPPATRRLKMSFPLLPMKECIELSQFAGEADHEDVRLLFDAAAGRHVGAGARAGTEPQQAGTTDAGASTLDAVLSEINGDALARNIGLPIDTARAAYQMDAVTTESYELGANAVAAFYLHLLRHARSVVGAVDTRSVEADALDLLGRTFAKHGGVDAAFAEIRDGTHGGLRFVLDAMTEQFKLEQQNKYVNWVLKNALDPLDWARKVAFMAALLERLGPHLPEDVRSQPPERFAKHSETVVRHYVESLDRVKVLLRAI